jgi:hypothetical protein
MNLSGIWHGINDDSYYFIRQLGNEIWWLGSRGNFKWFDADWANVAHGIISGNTINLEWADVPLGRNRNSGNLTVHIQSNPERLIRPEQAGFSTMTWERFTGNLWE